MGGGKSGDTPSSRAQAAFSNELKDQSRGVRSEYFSQILEALKTGGIGAQIPAIGQAVAASRAANSDTLRGLEGSLATSGLDRTPFGTMLLAQQRRTAGAATAAIPTDFAKSFIQAAPNAALGVAGPIVSGLGSAAGTEAGIKAQNAQTAGAAGSAAASIIAASIIAAAA